MAAYDVAVVGDWHLAFCTAAGLLKAGKTVLFVNPYPVEKAWADFPVCPVTEPELDQIQAAALREGRVAHSNDPTGKSWQSEFIWIAIDTPVNDRDEVDLTIVRATCDRLAHKAEQTRAVVMSSQVPLGFCAEMEAKTKLKIVYAPENLRLGQGIATFFEADRTVLGAAKPETALLVKEWLAKFETEFLTCNLETAEMIKHATNAFLATSISFANELARLGQGLGVDAKVVGLGLKLDKRIGPKAYVAPGLGFAGGTLPRDLRVLQELGRKMGKPSRLVDAVLDVNESTSDAVFEAIQARLEKPGSKVLILGYTYKADTDTLRRSLSVDLAAKIRQATKSEVYGFDPPMNARDRSSITPYLEHLHEAAQLRRLAPDVVVVMTARPLFKELELAALGSAKNTLLFDAVGLLDRERAHRAGFTYQRLWEEACPVN